MTHLLLTVRFLDDRYHGLLGRGGPPEWPPSPFRLFQALVAGVARRGELVVGEDALENTNFTPIGKALGWLQRHTREHPPIIIAPKSRTGQAITRFVPNNDGDKKLDRQERLTAKPTIPTLFLLDSDQKPEVHYVWDVSEPTDCPVDSIERAARSLTTLGWGIDMAFADARRVSADDLQKLKGIRWYPRKNAGSFHDTLRTPTYDNELGECTLCDLRHCHSTFINRIEHGKPLKPVDKPKLFDRVLYTSIERPIGRPYRVFELKDTDGSLYRYPHHKLIHIAGMVRHLAIKTMENDPPRGVNADWVERYVAGHTDESEEEHRQLSYLPLPSVGHEQTDPGVRRVMIAAPVGNDPWLDHVARRLAGQVLKPEPGQPDPFGGREPPILVLVPQRLQDKGVLACYTRRSNVWHSFTPVILPGHDDHKPDKTKALIKRALLQSGIEQPCEFEWSAYSRFPKSFTAHKYDKDRRPQGYIRPGYLNSQTAVHLTLRFHDGSDKKTPVAVPGPIAIGAGRHCGLGLFAAMESS
jgi:CRISPR-associated protein Csb2